MTTVKTRFHMRLSFPQINIAASYNGGCHFDRKLITPLNFCQGAPSYESSTLVLGSCTIMVTVVVVVLNHQYIQVV